jgi:nucleoside-diphosphate-sugar epimerase
VIKIALFGLGYTGKFLVKELTENQFQITGISRSTQLEGSLLINTETVEGVQQAEVLLQKTRPDSVCITFPPENAHVSFWKMLENRVSNRVLLGTTGIYSGTGRISEDSELLISHPRYARERQFLESGGSIIRLSGIYGPGRNPLNWINRARDLYEQKQLNLIHINDITHFIKLWLENPDRGEVYNLSDGQSHTWGEIARWARQKGIKMPEILPKAAWQPGEERNILPEKVLKKHPKFTFQVFFETLENQSFGEF